MSTGGDDRGDRDPELGLAEGAEPEPEDEGVDPGERGSALLGSRRRIIGLFTRLGFALRERFHAGAHAGFAF